LVVDEAVEKAQEAVTEGAESADYVFLVSLFVGEEGAFQGVENADALSDDGST
jgi:hypothetical protein